MATDLIDLATVRDRWRACYDAGRLAALYDRPHTPLEVLTRKDGPWAGVPDKDRLWTVLQEGVLPAKVLRLFACVCAERALLRERGAGREPDARSWRAVEVARRHALGTATDAELAEASAAYASAAACACARAAADDADDAERSAQVAALVRIIEENTDA